MQAIEEALSLDGLFLLPSTNPYWILECSGDGQQPSNQDSGGQSGTRIGESQATIMNQLLWTYFNFLRTKYNCYSMFQNIIPDGFTGTQGELEAG